MDDPGEHLVSGNCARAPVELMSQSKFLKCACGHCGGHIEFPAEGIGSTIPCPHCDQPTELTLDPPVIAARSPRSLKWLISGAVILIVGAGAVVAILFTAQRLMKRETASRPTVRIGARPMTTNIVSAKPPSTSPGKLINEFSFSAIAVEKTPKSTLAYATGTLKNQTDKQRFGVTVEIELFDTSGVKVGTTKDYVDLIEPRAEWKFRASVLQKNAASARVANVKEQ